MTFTIDGQPQTVWTTATTVDQAMDALIVDTAGADLSTSRSTAIGREGLDITIATAKTVRIKVAGKDERVTVTGLTVADALAAAKITVDNNDKLSVAPSAALEDGATLRYIRVDVKTKKKKQSVAYDTVRKKSKTLERGTTKVDVAGVTGVRTLTYRMVRHDGKIVERQADRQRADQEAEGPGAPGRHQGASGAQARSQAANPPAASDVLRQCLGPAGPVRVGRQLVDQHRQRLLRRAAVLARDLARVRREGYPHQNSQAQQIAVAKRLQAAAGWGQWPACIPQAGPSLSLASSLLDLGGP